MKENEPKPQIEINPWVVPAILGIITVLSLGARATYPEQAGLLTTAGTLTLIGTILTGFYALNQY